nr:type IV secretion system protein VirB10 [Agrobacterium sp. rho-13.3]MDX8311524.1 type IV secretion system protein VirB10 [Agrobacterium sp. rho-13.3]
MTITGQGGSHYPGSRDEEVAALDGDRGMPSVNAVKRSGRGRALVAVFFLFILLAVAAYAAWTLSKSADAPVKETKAAESTVPERKFVAPVIPEAEQPAVVPAIADTQPALPGTMTTTETSTDGLPVGPPPASLDKSVSGLMIEGTPSQVTATTTAADPATDAAADTRGGPLDGMLTGTKTPKRNASMLGNRNYILAKGAFINCALQTRLDSTVPGMTACRVTRDVFSDNGKVLLVERGSIVTGEYQANMKQGMERIYVLWTRIKTPFGVVVDLDSPATDALGGAGVPGHVNTHFWKRFGGAMLLSIIDDAAAYATQQRSSSSQSQTIQTDNTSDAASEMANTALESTINIPPTLTKNQGEQVGIFIARDLDFSGVYRVEPR